VDFAGGRTREQIHRERAEFKRAYGGLFVRWFDAAIAGDASRYEAIAEELWDLWRAPR
jgi:hypothetical protein